MKNIPFPVIVPKGHFLMLGQAYGSTKFNEWYRSVGITAPFHNGIDVQIYPDKEEGKITYGTACIAPFKCRKVKTTWEEPMSTKGNGITLQSEPFEENGKQVMLQIVFWHLSEFVDKKDFEAGEIVGYIGNSGIVSPLPTPERPYGGSHLHFMMYEFHNGVLQNQNNGVGGAIDPLTRFDIYKFATGDDTSPVKDTPPAIWAFSQRGITEIWQKIVFGLKYWLKK